MQNFQPARAAATQPERLRPKTDLQDSPFLLKQSMKRSQLLLWLLIGSTVGGVTWACVAKIEESIPAQGKLEPQGQVKNIQVPINGVIRQIKVQDGQAVKAGDILLEVDSETPKAQIKSLEEILKTLEQENQFYQSQLNGKSDAPLAANVPAQMFSLTKSRSTLLSENLFLQGQLDGSVTQMALNAQEQQRLKTEQIESQSRVAAVQLEINQIQEQIKQAEERRRNAQENLEAEERILQDIKPLAEAGGLSRIQFVKQQQTVDNKRSEMLQFSQEKDRLAASIAQTQAKVTNTVAVNRKDHTSQISLNLQKIAEIDSQLTKALVDNQRKISETKNQISQANQLLKYSDLKAPVAGTIFNLKATAPGHVANPAENILTIVPDNSLIAKVMITNRDIGFVRPGMKVDVRIDSFPFSEFGDVKGEIISIGSDALPPTELQPVYTFPAIIKLSRQSLNASGKEIRLQSGMSLNANIRVRERTVMSIFTDMFVKASESLKFIR
jgi:hemolysin D